MSEPTKFTQSEPSKFASTLAGIIVAVIALAGTAVMLAIPVIIWAWILTL